MPDDSVPTSGAALPGVLRLCAIFLLSGAVATLLLSGLVRMGWAQDAPTYTVLYTFTGRADGANPLVSVIRDAVGNLYGTTKCGGAYGTVWSSRPTRTFPQAQRPQTLGNGSLYD